MRERRGRLQLLMFLLFFISGVSGLVYQIVWTRWLVLVFGNTLLATSTVLTAFMAGLAAGSYWFGIFIDKRPRPLIKLYAVLEAAIGGFALLFPLLLEGATPLYVFLFRGLEGNLALLNLIRFTVCFVLILVPTFLMGGTLPVLLKRFVGDGRTIGHQVGLLYGLNTAGAMVGSLACGFLLLRVLGMQRTTWVAVAINLGVAVVAWLLAKGDAVADETNEITPGVEVEEGKTVPRHDSLTVTLVMVGIGLSGFCALAYEVFWTRMLNLFLNNNVYSFTAILATFLAGIALGSLIYSKLLSRVGRPVLLFTLIEVGIGVASYATPFIFNLLHRALFFRQSEALTLAKTAVIMIGPTILMGIAVPLAVQICQRGPHREGTSVGTVYAVNTIGAILGAFAAGFLLIPYVGLHSGLNVVVSLNLLAGFLALISIQPLRRRVVASMAFAGVLATVFLAAPATLFLDLYQKAQPSAEILHYKEGKIANVVVYDFVKSGYKDLYLNAIEEASSRLWHVQLFKMLGTLPALVHPAPDTGLMIAFGAGMSAGACVDHVTRLDCVDLNPDVQGVAEFFTPENRDVINNPRFNFIVNDGRNALLLDPQKHSLIISDATNPKTFDSWTLYTREFYELVKQRLEPGGVFSQWVLIPLPGDSIKILLNTFRSVFPHTSLWCIYGSSQCLMLATPERLEIDYRELSARLGPVLEPSGLAEYGVGDVDKFLSFLLLGEDELERALAGFTTINTDDLPHAQFRIRADKEGVRASLDLLENQAFVSRYLTNVGDDRDRLQRTQDGYRSIARRLHLGFLLNNRTEFLEALEVAATSGIPSDQNVKSALNYDSKKREYHSRRVREHPDDPNARNSLGYIYWMDGDTERAIEQLEQSVASSPQFANAHANLARAYTDAGMYDQAADAWLEVKELNPARDVLSMVSQELKILHQLRKLRYHPDSSSHWTAAAEAYLERGEVVKAAEATRVAAELSEGDTELYLRLAGMYENLEFVENALATYRKSAELLPQDRRIQRKVEEFEVLRSDGVARQRWLNSNEIVLASKEMPDGHPDSCSRAARAWSDYPFEGRIDEENLRRAAALYEESIRAKPDDLHAYADAARIREILGEIGEAASLWRQARQRAPESRIAESNNRRLDLLDRMQKESWAGEKRARALMEIATLYRLDGELEAATESLREAVAELPDHSVAWVNLGTVYVEAGMYPEAVAALERALELQPNGEGAEAIKERLEELRPYLEDDQSSISGAPSS